VSCGAPNDRAGSVDAVMVSKVWPPPATATDDLRGRLRPPRAEALLVRGRRAAKLVVDKNQPGWRLFRGGCDAITSTGNGSCDSDRRLAGPTEVFARLYAASGLSNTITLETKAFTSCVRPQALAMAPKSSAV
jgi:hypothetical protein